MRWIMPVPIETARLAGVVPIASLACGQGTASAARGWLSVMDEAPSEAEALPAASPMHGGHPRDRALVIDDDAAVRAVVAELLAALGWTVDVAADGVQGLAQFDAGAYRLVITDLRMPGMNGLEVARSVRGRASATAVILMSGMISVGTLERARELGVRLLPKPIELDTLETVVQLALRDVAPP